MRRVTEHPFLEITAGKELTFYYNGQSLKSREGDTIAAALTDNGIRAFRETKRRHEPRGLFCAIGQCTDCVMVVDGKPNVHTCVTLVKEGMEVETQIGVGTKQA
jgi:predicted molibdopterin-dependent oxidoreductase YjgC